MAVVCTIQRAWRGGALAGLVAGLALIAVMPAQAQQRGPQYAQCESAATIADQRIAACTTIIQANRDTTNTLGLAFAYRGMAYAAKADTTHALADYDEAIKRLPSNALAYNNRGFIYASMGQSDRALADYDKAIALDPKSVLAHQNRGPLLFKIGKYDAAAADFTALMQLDPKEVSNYYFMRGACWHYKRDFDRAIADYDEGIKVNPKMALAYVSRANAYNRKGQYDRALADAEQALKLDPNSSSSYANRGEAYRNKGELDRAIADFNQSIKLDPNVPTVYVVRGIANEAKGDIGQAREDYANAIALPPGIYFDAKEYQEKARERLAALAAAPTTAAPTTTTPAAPAPPAAVATAPARETVAPPAATTDAFQHKVALVIGNGLYQNATQLPNPPNDAADMAQMLRKMGFDVVEGRNLDYNGMKDAIRNFSRKLDRADLALFFYAGHGLQVNGDNFLVPIDAKLERAADLNFEVIDVNIVLQQMEAAKRVNLVFLDACRDNPLSRSLARSMGSTRSAAVNTGLAAIDIGLGTMISFATSPQSVALDGDGRNSPFTGALLKHLPTPGLDISLVMRRVRSDVLAATREQQRPWDNSSLVGEVILAR